MTKTDPQAISKSRPAVKKESKAKIYKLQAKTKIQKEILNTYFEQHPSEWERKEILAISEKTNLSFDQVYKYLWNKRNKEKEKLHPQKYEAKS